MDPIGLALENFDHTGKWRELDGACAIDASGQLADGTKVNGPDSLRQALLARSDVFVTRGRREAADLRRRPPDAARGHACGAGDRARRGAGRLSLVVVDPRRREDAAVPDANESRRAT